MLSTPSEMATRFENKRKFETDAQAQAGVYIEMNNNRNSARVWTGLSTSRQRSVIRVCEYSDES
jgi:hypothetical protein